MISAPSIGDSQLVHDLSFELRPLFNPHLQLSIFNIHPYLEESNPRTDSKRTLNLQITTFSSNPFWAVAFGFWCLLFGIYGIEVNIFVLNHRFGLGIKPLLPPSPPAFNSFSSSKRRCVVLPTHHLLQV